MAQHHEQKIAEMDSAAQAALAETLSEMENLSRQLEEARAQLSEKSAQLENAKTQLRENAAEMLNTKVRPRVQLCF
jgi:hypothetical protein